jgi:hypothetical protein
LCLWVLASVSRGPEEVSSRRKLAVGPGDLCGQRFLMSATTAAGIGMKIISSDVLAPLV